MKTCIACGETKELTAFKEDRKCRGGRRPRCKDCVREGRRKRWAGPNLVATPKVDYPLLKPIGTASVLAEDCRQHEADLEWELQTVRALRVALET